MLQKIFSKYNFTSGKITLEVYVRDSENGNFFCKKSKAFVLEKEQQRNIIHDTHEGTGESSHFKAMASYEKIKAHFSWYGIFSDVPAKVNNVNYVRNKKVYKKQ